MRTFENGFERINGLELELENICSFSKPITQ